MYAFVNGELPKHFGNYFCDTASAYRYHTTRLALLQNYHLPSGVVLLVRAVAPPHLPVTEVSLSTNMSEKQAVSACAGQLAAAAGTYKVELRHL